VTAQTLPVRQVPAQFTGPVSLIQGEADVLLPVSLAEDYVTILADGELRLLPDRTTISTTTASSPRCSPLGSSRSTCASRLPRPTWSRTPSRENS
jgi:hypothetical protein